MEEVIGRANKNNYGLAAAVFTKDVSNALFMSNRWKDGYDGEYDDASDANVASAASDACIVVILVILVVQVVTILVIVLLVLSPMHCSMQCSSQMGHLDDHDQFDLFPKQLEGRNCVGELLRCSGGPGLYDECLCNIVGFC